MSESPNSKSDGFMGALIVVAVISILVALFLPFLAAAKQAQKRQESWSHIDYVVLGEGRFDKAVFNYDGQQHTMVYFQDGSVVHMSGINSVGYDRGDKIRISQKRLGAGTKYEKMEPIYKIDLLEAEAK